MGNFFQWVNLSNKCSLFVAVLVFISRSDRVVKVPYLDARIVCSFCLAIRMISNTVMLLTLNGCSLRRAIAEECIVTRRFCRSLNWNLQSFRCVAVFMVLWSLRGTLQSSSCTANFIVHCSLHRSLHCSLRLQSSISIGRNTGTDSHGSPGARGWTSVLVSDLICYIRRCKGVSSSAQHEA
jgi:hypothetical protein